MSQCRLRANRRRGQSQRTPTRNAPPEHQGSQVVRLPSRPPSDRRAHRTSVRGQPTPTGTGQPERPAFRRGPIIQMWVPSASTSASACSLDPQQVTVPSTRTPQECHSPADTISPSEGVGTVVVVGGTVVVGTVVVVGGTVVVGTAVIGTAVIVGGTVVVGDAVVGATTSSSGGGTVVIGTAVVVGGSSDRRSRRRSSGRNHSQRCWSPPCRELGHPVIPRTVDRPHSGQRHANTKRAHDPTTRHQAPTRQCWTSSSGIGKSEMLAVASAAPTPTAAAAIKQSA